MSISGNIRVGLNITHTGTSDLTSLAETVLATADQSLWTVTDGTGANQMDRLWHDQRTVTASSNDDLDLAGVLVNVFGTTITLARVKLLYIKAAAANGSTLSVGGAATNPLSTLFGATNDVLKIRPGGTLLLIAPEATAYAVTGGSADVLRITNDNGGASATYDIIIGGASS